MANRLRREETQTTRLHETDYGVIVRFSPADCTAAKPARVTLARSSRLIRGPLRPDRSCLIFSACGHRRHVRLARSKVL